MKDLTAGHPGRVLIRYTLPLFGSIIFQQLYSIADSLVAGRFISTEALAAVGNSYEITLIYIAMAFGCNVGASVVIARLFGEKNHRDLRTACTTALIFAAVLGLLLTAAGLLCSGWMLELIHTPQELMRDSREYLDIYLAGYLFLIIYQVSTGIFSAMGDSATPFRFLAISSTANILVDIFFVVSLHIGVAGVAWATFLCQGISGTAAFVCILRKILCIPSEGRVPLFSFPILGRIIRIAAPSAVQQGCISVGNIMIQSVINTFGTAATGGYAAAIKLNNLVITSLTAMGNGISNFTSQNLGAGQTRRVRSGLGYGVLMCVCVCLFFTACYQLFCEPLLRLFLTDTGSAASPVTADALRIGTLFLRIVTPFYVIVGVKLAADGMLRGSAAMTAFMVGTMTDLVLRVLLCFVLSGPFGITGVWCSWPIGWAIGTCVSLVLAFRLMKRQAAQSSSAEPT